MCALPRSQGTRDLNGGLGLCAKTGALLYPEPPEMIGREAERATLRQKLEVWHCCSAAPPPRPAAPPHYHPTARAPPIAKSRLLTPSAAPNRYMTVT